MFGDDNKNKLTLLNTMKITIVDNEEPNNELCQMIYGKITKEYVDKIKISSIQNISDLYSNISQNKEETSQGLLNTLWVEEISTSRPSVIILYYYIKEGSTKEEEEIKISKIIEEISQNDKNVYVYLFIMIPPQEMDIYQHLKDDDKSPNAIRKKLERDFIYIFTSKDITKTIELSKLCNSLIICSTNYYRKLKKEIMTKKNESMNLEEIIKYDIMMGVLSTLKSKKKEICLSKHLKEAYDIICSKSFDHKKYLYGNPENTKQNFFEIRAIADWLLFKIMNLNLKITENMYANKKKNQIVTKQKNLDAQSKIDIIYNHIKIFSSFDYGDKDKEGDPFYFFRDFWTYKRYINLMEFFEKNINELKDEKKYINKIGIVILNILFIFMKMIKFYKKYLKDIDMTNVTINNSEIPINLISTKSNIYYAKPPNFVYEDPNTNEKIEIGYNDEIYLKKVIINNDLTLDKMFVRLKNTLIPNILLFYYKTAKLQKGYEISNIANDNVILCKQNAIKENDMRGLEIYLNILRLNASKEGIDENNLYAFSDINDIMFDLYMNFDLYENCKKFPKIYINFLNKFTKCLIYQMENLKENEKFNNAKKTALFKSLSILGSYKLLNEKEQDIFNILLNDEEFIPSYEDKEEDNMVLEINNNVVDDKNETEDIEKNLDKKYAKKNDILININLPKNYNKVDEPSSISFEYSIKDIEKSQERKILDLVEYEFKFSLNLEKIKLQFDNIKIFFVCINEGPNDIKGKNEKEVLIKEFKKEELSNYELTKDTPLMLQHKIFLKYKKGKIFVSKIMASLSKKNNIIYSFDVPSEFKKVIFIKNSSQNVLNFNYRKSYKIGKNQYVPFDLIVSKEKNDDVKIEDFKIQFETIPTFVFKEFSNPTPVKATKEEEKEKEKEDSPQEEKHLEQEDHYSSNSLKFGQQRISVKEKDKKTNNINNTDFVSIKRSVNLLSKRISATSLDFSHLNKIEENSDNNIEKKNTGNMPTHTHIKVKNSPIKAKNTNPNQKHMLPAPEFYIYNKANNCLVKFTNSMEIKYNNFESLLDQGQNKYATLLKFLHEGSFKIKFSIIYYIRHKEIADYIEFVEESILDFNIVKPFVCTHEIFTNNFLKIEQKRYGMKQNQNDEENENRVYLTDSKIGLNFILTNRIEEDIQIKDIIIDVKNDQSIKYINSYLNDLIHSYDLEEEEKNEILVIKKSSSYSIPFETEFANAFNGSIGKITIVWNTKSMECYEEGKFNLLNKDEFSFPDIEVRPIDFEYSYNTQMNENKEILLDIEIKNKSNKSRQILVTIGNKEESIDKGFIIIGIARQTHIIREREAININYKLIPIGRGECDFPYVRVFEKDSSTKEKTFNNFYFSEKIAII